jgi:hypothetical protein
MTTFCCTCRRISNGSEGTTFCAYCGRSFGRVCANKHLQPLHTRVCGVCGNTELSEGTRFIRIAWLSRLLAALLLLAIWKWLILPNLGPLAGLGGRIALWGMAVLTNSTPCCVLRFLYDLLAWILVIWMLGHLAHLLPGEGGSIGRWMRGLVPALFTAALRLLPKFLVALWLGIRLLVGLPPRKSRDGDKGKKDH